MLQNGKRKERRRYSRNTVGKVVPVLWEAENGQEMLLQGRLLDVSVSGARVWLPMRLPDRSPVSFNCLDLGVGGRGTVRYCNAVKGGYEVGLELSTGTGWRDQKKDLENLAAALDNSLETTVRPSNEVKSEVG